MEALLPLGARVPWTAAWSALYAGLVWDVLKIAARGHEIVGALRLFGFNVFRNTYKPLLAPSLVEFWNRYYYYFKEMLAWAKTQTRPGWLETDPDNFSAKVLAVPSREQIEAQVNTQLIVEHYSR